MPESPDVDEGITVPAGDAERLIRLLKRHLTGSRTCRVCGYEAAVGQWGYRTEPVDDGGEVLVRACCPACESPVRLRAVADDPE